MNNDQIGFKELVETHPMFSDMLDCEKLALIGGYKYNLACSSSALNAVNSRTGVAGQFTQSRYICEGVTVWQYRNMVLSLNKKWLYENDTKEYRHLLHLLLTANKIRDAYNVFTKLNEAHGRVHQSS